MKSFAVIAHLETPVVMSQGWLTLDALLASQIFRQTEDIERAHGDIPLCRTDKVWHGSAAMFLVGDVGVAPFCRSMKGDDLDSDAWVPLKGKYPYWIDQGRSGAKKNQWLTTADSHDTIASPKALWFGNGDPERVLALMTSLLEWGGVGRKTSQGYGKIGSVELIESQADFSLEAPGGEPARPIPAEMWQGMGRRVDVAQANAACCPPYFASEQVPCVVPSSRLLTPGEWRAYGRACA